MPSERTKGDRVTFERGLPVHLIGIEGTWTREGLLDDVSETGAKLTLPSPLDEAALKEFFLLLSMSGLPYRRCELAWVNGEQIGVNFVSADDNKNVGARRGAES